MASGTQFLQRSLLVVLALVTLSQVLYLNLNVYVGWETESADRKLSAKDRFFPAWITFEIRAKNDEDVDDPRKGGDTSEDFLRKPIVEEKLPSDPSSAGSSIKSETKALEQPSLSSFRVAQKQLNVQANSDTKALEVVVKAQEEKSNKSDKSLPGPVKSLAWRVQSCVNMGLWDVHSVTFMRKNEILTPYQAIASGSASDGKHGVTGYEASNAVVNHSGTWGGRPDGESGAIWIGGSFKTPVDVGCVSLLQSWQDKHTTDCVKLMRLSENNQWVVESQLYDIEVREEAILCNPWVDTSSKDKKQTSGSQLSSKEMKELFASNTTQIVLYSEFGCRGERRIVTQQHHRMCLGEAFSNGHPQTIGPGGIESMRVVGSGEVDLFSDCRGDMYVASLLPLDGCTDWHFSNYPTVASFRILEESSINKVQSPEVAWSEDGQLRRGTKEESGKQIRIVCSVESSEYHGYQIQANLYSYHDTNQSQHGAMWTRLMTSSEPDDMSDMFPTFHAKRHPYSYRYSPLNKADVTAKWFASVNAPGPNEVIVMLDPDNWLLQPLGKYAAQVSPGRALAEAAWFNGQSTLVRKLWNKFCRANCESAKLDMAAVPYFIHSSDLAKLAPLWKEYCLIMSYQLASEAAMAKEFHSLQITWCIEMFAYVFAAAELGIRHTIDHNLQVRDVDGLPREEILAIMPMIHIGRAWFPPDYKPGAIWHHTEGAAWKHHGAQVWCKCNYTSSNIIPWPIPEGVQFVSRHTLRILHDAREFFGPMPVSKYRVSGMAYAHGYP